MIATSPARSKAWRRLSRLWKETLNVTSPSKQELVLWPAPPDVPIEEMPEMRLDGADYPMRITVYEVLHRTDSTNYPRSLHRSRRNGLRGGRLDR